MDKVIVSGLLLIASLTAAVITISIITPALGSDRDSITNSKRVATKFVGTGIEGLSAVVEGQNGAAISAWFKNTGATDIGPVSAIDVFLLSGNRFSGRYIEFSSTPPPATDSWSVLEPADSAIWAKGETIHIRLVLNAVPIATGSYIISLTTPNGVSGEFHFEHGDVPLPTLTPIPGGPGVSFSRVAATVSERGAGNSNSFTVTLETLPSSTVVLSVTSSDPGEVTAEPPTLTFTVSDWSVPQTVTLTGVDESTGDGEQQSKVIVSVVDEFSAEEFRDAGDSTMIVTTIDNGVGGLGPTSFNKPLAEVFAAGGVTSDRWEIHDPSRIVQVNSDGERMLMIAATGSYKCGLDTWYLKQGKTEWEPGQCLLDGEPPEWAVDFYGLDSEVTDPFDAWAPAMLDSDTMFYSIPILNGRPECIGRLDAYGQAPDLLWLDSGGPVGCSAGGISALFDYEKFEEEFFNTLELYEDDIWSEYWYAGADKLERLWTVISLALETALASADPDTYDDVWDFSEWIFEERSEEIVASNSYEPLFQDIFPEAGMIDPSLFMGDQDQALLLWGGGAILGTSIDRHTGEPLDDSQSFSDYYDSPLGITLDESSIESWLDIPVFSLVPSTGAEASYLTEIEGEYYLFWNWGACCREKPIDYHINVARASVEDSRFVNKVGGPISPGCCLFLAGTPGKLGAGHTGIFSYDTSEGDTVNVLSYHYYPEPSPPGPWSWVGTKVLEWEDGWPVPGDDWDPLHYWEQ